MTGWTNRRKAGHTSFSIVIKICIPVILLTGLLCSCGKLTRTNDNSNENAQTKSANTTESNSTLPQATIADPPKKEQTALTVGESLFLLQRVAVITEDGVIAIPPGTVVRLIKDNGLVDIVTNEKQEFKVPRDYLTRDARVAQAILSSYQQAQSTLSQIHEGETQLLTALEAKSLAEARPSATPVIETKDSGRPVYVNPLNRGAYGQQRSISYPYYYPYPYPYYRTYPYYYNQQ